ncbi:hypothetical protein ACFY20_42910 [Streptomyces sp. NPDC001312]
MDTDGFTWRASYDEAGRVSARRGRRRCAAGC